MIIPKTTAAEPAIMHKVFSVSAGHEIAATPKPISVIAAMYLITRGFTESLSSLTSFMFFATSNPPELSLGLF